MKARIRLLSAGMAIAMMLSSPVYAQASSSTVGEYVPLHSGGLPDTTTGSSTTTTLTEEQRQANQTNSTASKSIQQNVGKIISSSQVEEGYTIRKDGSYIFIMDQTVDIEKLRELVESGAVYTPVGYGYRIYEYTPGTPDITQEDKTVFRNVVSHRLGGAGNTSGLERTQETDPIVDITKPSGAFVWENIQ